MHGDGALGTFILCGGAGTRLWPLSQREKPKQFHSLGGSGSLLSQTICRAKLLSDPDKIFLIGSAEHQELLAQHCAASGLDPANCFLEPYSKNTTAAFASACWIAERSGLKKLLVLPSDHAISNHQAFQECVQGGLNALQADEIVTFGVRPTEPNTGYGYIKTSPSLIPNQFLVDRFVEKPDHQTASGFCEEDDCFWNSGIYLFETSSSIEHMKLLVPVLWKSIEKAHLDNTTLGSGLQLIGSQYASVPSISFDKAITEQVANIKMIEASFDWQDLGSWQSMFAAMQKDARGNLISGNVIAVGTSNSLIHSDGNLLTVSGAENLALISIGETIFAQPLNHANHADAIDQIAKAVAKRNKPEVQIIKLAEEWFLSQALPKWQYAVTDQINGGFHDALDFDFNPTADPKRLRTMGRLTHAFALATSRGMMKGGFGTVEHGISYLESVVRGNSRAIPAHDDIGANPADFYDLSTVLLGAATAASIGTSNAEDLATHVFTQINDSEMLWSKAKGVNCDANTAMHLHEAVLTWYEVSREPQAAKRASQLIEFFHNRLLETSFWAVSEGKSSSEKNAYWEPGHSYEWAWRLHRHAAVFKSDDRKICERLDAVASCMGSNEANGLPWLRMEFAGGPTEKVSRSWGCLESIRSAIALIDMGNPQYEQKLHERVRLFFEAHINNAPEGGWIDRLDPSGTALSANMPSSTLYHLVNAFTGYLAFADRKARADIVSAHMH